MKIEELQKIPGIFDEVYNEFVSKKSYIPECEIDGFKPVGFEKILNNMKNIFFMTKFSGQPLSKDREKTPFKDGDVFVFKEQEGSEFKDDLVVYKPYGPGLNSNNITKSICTSARKWENFVEWPQKNSKSGTIGQKADIYPAAMLCWLVIMIMIPLLLNSDQIEKSSELEIETIKRIDVFNSRPVLINETILRNIAKYVICKSWNININARTKMNNVNQSISNGVLCDISNKPKGEIKNDRTKNEHVVYIPTQQDLKTQEVWDSAKIYRDDKSIEYQNKIKIGGFYLIKHNDFIYRAKLISYIKFNSVIYSRTFRFLNIISNDETDSEETIDVDDTSYIINTYTEETFIEFLNYVETHKFIPLAPEFENINDEPHEVQDIEYELIIECECRLYLFVPTNDEMNKGEYTNAGKGAFIITKIKSDDPNFDDECYDNYCFKMVKTDNGESRTLINNNIYFNAVTKKIKERMISFIKIDNGKLNMACIKFENTEIRDFIYELMNKLFLKQFDSSFKISTPIALPETEEDKSIALPETEEDKSITLPETEEREHYEKYKDFMTKNNVNIAPFDFFMKINYKPWLNNKFPFTPKSGDTFKHLGKIFKFGSDNEWHLIEQQQNQQQLQQQIQSPPDSSFAPPTLNRLCIEQSFLEFLGISEMEASENIIFKRISEIFVNLRLFEANDLAKSVSKNKQALKSEIFEMCKQKGYDMSTTPYKFTPF